MSANSVFKQYPEISVLRPTTAGGGIKSLLSDIDGEVSEILGVDFTVESTSTEVVPLPDDPTLTFSDGAKTKILETCVLYVDIRNSSSINVSTHPEILAKLYSAFARSMIRAADYFGGKVRNIVGDRLMVVFDRKDCFANAVDTAFLFNTIAHKIIRPEFDGVFSCGIGIDFGKMMVTKVGTRRTGDERENYRSLVWLGPPANIASKLTDVANKTTSTTLPVVVSEWFDPVTRQWIPRTDFPSQFVSRLKETFPLNTATNSVVVFDESTEDFCRSFPPVLITEAVLTGLCEENPQHQSLRERSWSPHFLSDLPADHLKVFGSDRYYQAIDEIR